jgi:hypothetical protein
MAGADESMTRKKILAGLCAAILALTLTAPARAAEKPLSADDVVLMLLAGASTDKMLAIIEQRGIDFRLNPDLAQKFHNAGADDLVIDALQKASVRPDPTAKTIKPLVVKSTKAMTKTQVIELLKSGVSMTRVDELVRAYGIDFDVSPDVESELRGAGATEPLIETLREVRKKSEPPVTPAPAPTAERTRPAPAEPPDTTEPPAKASVPTDKPRSKLAPLSDPSPIETARIVQEFAAKEKVFKEARGNYTYHQLNKLTEYDEEGNPRGVFQQEWDILFEDSGKRIERVTYAPPDTLKRLIITKEDLENFRSIQPFVLTSDELPEYDVKYLGHVRVDEITAYVFDVRPKEIKKDHLYFQGRVWVDDRDLQIVKSEGKTVPQDLKSKGQQNLFPRFTTYREQIDGKFWFPTYTLADDTLYFANGPVKIKEIIRYTDYKQFKSRVRILSTEAVDAPQTPPASGTTPASKPPAKKK